MRLPHFLCHFTGDIENDRTFFQRAVMESHEVGLHVL